MLMSHSVAARNAAVAAVTALGNWCSLHTGDPGTTGANEVVGVTRAQTTWGAPSAGSSVGTPANIGVPAGGPYTHYGVWSLVSGGAFVSGGVLDAPESYGAPGVYALTPTETATG
jgi:hypothetical protein